MIIILFILMTSLINKNEIVITTKNNKEYKFDVELLSNLSNFIKNIIEDNDEFNIPMNNFTNSDLDLLNEYIIFIKNSEYDFKKNKNVF
jgi:hypothetical protein